MKHDMFVSRTQPAKDFYVKSNKVILGGCYDLDIWSLRVWHYFIIDAVNRFTGRSKTLSGMTHDEFMEQTLSQVKGKNFSYLHKAVQQLSSMSIRSFGNDSLLKVFDDVNFDKGCRVKRRTLSATFSDEFKPFILLGGNYTRCSVRTSLSFKSTYSIRLNEMIQACLGMNSRAVNGVRKTNSKLLVDTEVLRKLFCLEDKYRDVYSLKKKTLYAAKDEFDRLREINVLPYSFDILPTNRHDRVVLICSGALENGISIADEEESAQIIDISSYGRSISSWL